MENGKIRNPERWSQPFDAPPAEGRPDFWFAESSSARANIARLNQVGSTPHPKASLTPFG